MRPRHQLSSLQTETSAKKQCRDQDINQGTIQRPRNQPRNSPRHQVFNIETRTSGISQGTVLRQRHLPRNCLRDQAISQGTVQRPSNQPRNSLETETQAKKKKCRDRPRKEKRPRHVPTRPNPRQARTQRHTCYTNKSGFICLSFRITLLASNRITRFPFGQKAWRREKSEAGV